MENENVWSTDWSDKPFEELKKITERVKVQDDYSYKCSTHIDVLNDVINTANVKSVIEFGGGYWPTLLLLNKCEFVTTIEQGQNVSKEMNDLWSEKLKDLYCDNPKWTFIKSPGYYDWKSLKFGDCDMVFIDGFPDARAEILQYFIDKDCPVIVAHDTEHDGFHWSKVDNKEYRRIDYYGYTENKTTLWTKENGLIGKIVKLSNYAIVNTEIERVFEKSIKKIISFSLWSANLRYWEGAIKNIQLAKVLYPGWICRFYIEESAPANLINMIREHDCEIVLMKFTDAFSGLFWRFYAADDADVMICRDADSIISELEVEAVRQWMETGFHFHIMRDHFQHKSLIMGGMWGCRNIEGISELINQYPNKSLKGDDQCFLAQQIYPQIKYSAIIHDSYNHFGDGIDFPTLRYKNEFVGKEFDS